MMAPLNVKADPIKLMPVVPLVVRFPRKLVVPAPADWMIEAALTDPAEILFALEN